jgi:CheY-like chemotaxis protein
MHDTDSPHDESGDAELIFMEDEPAGTVALSPDANPWRILIVDDDVDVHVVTKFALSNTQFQGRRLSYLHAYSGAEALSILSSRPDIALVLLDVIMETPDAGLRVARAIRDELHNHLVRVVLRTGQPGQHQESALVADYDVNDFWSKADLTTRKLLTTVLASLRTYGELAHAAAENQALRRQAEQDRRMHIALDHHALMLTLDGAGRIVDASALLCDTLGVAHKELLGRLITAVQRDALPRGLVDEILYALHDTMSWNGTIHAHRSDGTPLILDCGVQAFVDTAGAPAADIALATLRERACFELAY